MLTLISPAKINLFLRVIGKRPDGYHSLSSLFQTINLVDRIHFELYSHDVLTCTDPNIPTDNSNLILKATRLFREKTGLSHGLKVHIEKRIPIQAGLGGGSSNAATALWAFNQLTGKNASTSELQAWSSEIGSDIPFFFSEGTAYCTGRGEHVRTLDSLPAKSCWIVKPKIGLSTPEIYKKLGMKASEKLPECGDDLTHFFSFNKHFNDLEKPAFETKPELKEIKQMLMSSGFETVLLTGSGSAFFCLGDGVPPVHKDVEVFFTRFINRHSLNWY